MKAPPSFACAALLVIAALAPVRGTTLAAAEVTELPPLAGAEPGNPGRGRLIVRDRSNVTCLICHEMPIPEEPDHGQIGPPLHGVGGRYTQGELRLRLVDPKAINPDTIMPSFYRVDGLYRVAAPYRGRTIYTAQQIEDVVAYLATLADEKE